MKTSFIVALAALAIAAAASAAEQRGSWCMTWYDDPFDAQQAAQRYALTYGAQSVITFASAAREYANVVAYRTGGGGCVGIPEAPYGWKTFPTIAEAEIEHDAHAAAEARGVVSTYDGSFIVYWTKPAYVTK